MSRHRLCLACGGLDIFCASCCKAVKGEQSSPRIKNANGGIVKISTMVVFIRDYQDGRRLALSGGTVTLRLHRNPQGNRKERRAEANVDDRRIDFSAWLMPDLFRSRIRHRQQR